MQTPQGFRVLESTVRKIEQRVHLDGGNKSEVVRNAIRNAAQVPKKDSRVSVSYGLDEITRAKLRRLVEESGRSESDVLDWLMSN